MILKILLVFSIGILAALFASSSVAGSRNIRVDNPGAPCDVWYWTAVSADPNAAFDGNSNGLQNPSTFFNPGTVVTPPAIYCIPTLPLATLWSPSTVSLNNPPSPESTQDPANPASDPTSNSQGAPTIAKYTATSAVMYEWLNSAGTNAPDAEVIVWNLPASTSLPGGGYEIEFDNWCSYNDYEGSTGSQAPPSNAVPSFTWREYYFTYSGTCANYNGYDLILSASGTLVGYVDLNNNTYLNPSGSGWTAALSPAETNSALGATALFSNASGYFNNAAGYYAMYANTTGYNNNAQGSFALSSNVSGYGNSAMGANSLLSLTSGNRNVGVGNNTGTNLVGGSYNVDIGWGVGGSGDETGVVRIGNPTYAQQTYIAGVAGNVVSGAAVYVTAAGQLGVLASSERFKTDITSLSQDGDKLQQLRPVSFHLKTEPDGALQFGLIAEEVDKVFPELVIRDEAGKIQGVRYEELTPLLLSQVQQQRQQIVSMNEDLLTERAERISDEEALAAEASELAELKQQFEKLLGLNRNLQMAVEGLQAKEPSVALSR